MIQGQLFTSVPCELGYDWPSIEVTIIWIFLRDILGNIGVDWESLNVYAWYYVSIQESYRYCISCCLRE